MATNYPTFQSDPTLNSVTASSAVFTTNLSASQITGSHSGSLGLFTTITGSLSGTLGLFTTLTASSFSASNYIGLPAGGVLTVTAGTNISSSGGASTPIINLTSSITGGLTNISGTTTITSVSGNYVVLTASSKASIDGIFIGRAQIPTGSTGVRNIGIGLAVLSANKSGSDNIAIGDNALASVNSSNGLDGGGNLAIGNTSLSGNTLGYSNVGIGINTLTYNTVGNQNTGIGVNTFNLLSLGNSNTAIGPQAGSTVTSLLNGVIIGGNNGSTINGTTGSIIVSDGAGNIRIQANSTGLISIPGALTVSGNVILGDASSDSVTATAQLTASTGLSSSLGLFNAITGSAISSSGITSLLGIFTTLTASNISSSGNMTLGGNITLSNAGGIVFGTTAGAAGTRTSNTISDYEIGTWTPTIDIGGSGFNGTSANTGSYVKIGNIVSIFGNINISNTGSFTGTVRLSGLPFSPLTYDSSLIISRYSNLAAGFSGNPYGAIFSSNGYIYLYKYASGGSSTQLDKTDLLNNAIFYYSGIYYAT